MLAGEPGPHGCEKLSGYDNLYRARVGNYRIVYGVEDRLVVVVVLKVGHEPAPTLEPFDRFPLTWGRDLFYRENAPAQGAGPKYMILQ